MDHAGSCAELSISRQPQAISHLWYDFFEIDEVDVIDAGLITKALYVNKGITDKWESALFFTAVIPKTYHCPNSWHNCIACIHLSMIGKYIKNTYNPKPMNTPIKEPMMIFSIWFIFFLMLILLKKVFYIILYFMENSPNEFFPVIPCLKKL